MNTQTERLQFELPQEAVIWPRMAVSSWTTKHGGAFRLYVLARALDPKGSGHIHADLLKAAALRLHVKPRTFAYWLADALNCGIFEKLHDGVLRVHSQQRVLRILGGRSIDKRKVIIPLKSLFKKGWHARAWAAYIKANHNGNPISQKKLEEITGVPVRTQKNLNRYIKSKRQIGITNLPANHVTGLNEYSSPGKAFVFIDPAQKNARVAAIHLPSVKTVSNRHARTAQAGRRSTILAHLRRHGLACDFGQLSFLQADNRTVTRLFYSTPKQREAIPYGLGMLPQDPDRIFFRRGKRAAWDVVFL